MLHSGVKIPANKTAHTGALPSAGLSTAWCLPADRLSVDCLLQCRMHIQYKYVVRNHDGSVVRWQEGDNVSLDLPGGSAAALALDVEDSWNKSKQVQQHPGLMHPV